MTKKYYNQLRICSTREAQTAKENYALLKVSLPVMSSRLKSMRSSAKTVDTEGSQVGCKEIPSTEYLLKKKDYKSSCPHHPKGEQNQVVTPANKPTISY